MTAPRMAEIASLIGDPARANMLSALMAGRALTASELAYAAHVSAQTTSGHLAKLTDSGLLMVTKQGRHRYYRLAGPAVAGLIEQIMIVAGDDPRRPPMRGPRQGEMRIARTCYDHIAGQLGVGIADALLKRRHIVLSDDGGEVTDAGLRFFSQLGIRPDSVPGRRPFCRACLDWTERRPHLAGKVGTAMVARFLERRWIAHRRDSRILQITPAGARAFRDLFDVTL